MPEGSRIALGQLRGTLKSHISSTQADIKRRGIDSLTGNDRQDVENLLRQLAAYGVFMVPAGELEQWLPGLSRGVCQNKSEWLVQTFQAMGEDPDDSAYLRPATDDVWAFVGSIRSWLHNANRLGVPRV